MAKRKPHGFGVTQDPDVGKKTRFQKGVCANPGGRPKKLPLTEMFIEVCNEIANDPVMREQFKAMIREKLHSPRVVGAMTLSTVLDRVEGKVVQPLDVAGEVNIKDLLESARQKLADSEPDQLPTPTPEVVQ